MNPPTPTGAVASGWPAHLARIRLASGLLLFTFAATHLLNHALGIVSLDAMEAGRKPFLAFWRWTPISILLLAALVVHPLVALARLWERRSLRMPAIEWTQLLLGFTIPWYLIVHLLGTGGLSRCCGVVDSYTYLVSLLWPGGALDQGILVALVWIHGCIGMHRWLRLRGWYRRFEVAFAVIAVVLPILAVMGFLSAGREITARLASEPEWLRQLGPTQGWPVDEIRQDFVFTPRQWIERGFGLVLGLVVIGWAVREARARGNQLRIEYDNGRKIQVPLGLSLLEASRVGGIPHASVCGGRGRCSTCRVRVLAGGERLPAPAEDEQRLLTRIGAAGDVRLACRLRPIGDLSVARLMPTGATADAALRSMDPAQGHEREIVVLFADLRGFTRLAESRLPYDTVYLLNRYFAAMGRAIEASGGRVDKFIGDGIMALFGLERDAGDAARQSLVAAVTMAERLQALNTELEQDLPRPLRMGIGIHLGTAIVGEMGYGRATGLTAIGDTVNVASRLEGLTKELGCVLVVSEELLIRAEVPIGLGSAYEMPIRGRSAPMALRGMEDLSILRPYLAVSATAAPPRAREKLSAMMRKLSPRG